jgi:hypothetical protein
MFACAESVETFCLCCISAGDNQKQLRCSEEFNTKATIVEIFVFSAIEAALNGADRFL